MSVDFTHWRIRSLYFEADNKRKHLSYLNWVVIWLVNIGHRPVLLAIHGVVVVFAVLVLHWIHNTLPAFKSKLKSQLWPSVAPLYHCLDLTLTQYKKTRKSDDTWPQTNGPHTRYSAWPSQMSGGCILLWFLGCNPQSKSSWIPAQENGRRLRLKSTNKISFITR